MSAPKVQNVDREVFDAMRTACTALGVTIDDLDSRTGAEFAAIYDAFASWLQLLKTDSGAEDLTEGYPGQRITGPDVVTTPPEARQIARVFQFDAHTAFAIDWNKIAQTARELGAHFEARTGDDGAVVVTMFWAYADEATS